MGLRFFGLEDLKAQSYHLLPIPISPTVLGSGVYLRCLLILIVQPFFSDYHFCF